MVSTWLTRLVQTHPPASAQGSSSTKDSADDESDDIPTNSRRLTILDLPPEIQIEITSQLIYPDALSLKHTCRYFYSFVFTGIELKVEWFLSRRRLHLDCPNGIRCDFDSDLRFCRGSVPLLMQRRREHIECESRPDLGCLIYGTATCVHRRRRFAVLRRWLRRRLTVEMRWLLLAIVPLVLTWLWFS